MALLFTKKNTANRINLFTTGPKHISLSLKQDFSGYNLSIQQDFPFKSEETI